MVVSLLPESSFFWLLFKFQRAHPFCTNTHLYSLKIGGKIQLVTRLRKNCVKQGRGQFLGFKILNKDFDRRNLNAVIDLLCYSSLNMKSPRMMHFIAKIEDFNSFRKTRFSQTFKTKFTSNMKQRNKERNATAKTKRTKLPDFHFFYSLESKIVQGSKYDHIHLMVIFDTNHKDYGHKELQIAVTKSLSSMPGVEKLSYNKSRTIFTQSCGRELPTGFLKLRNRKSTISAVELRDVTLAWHDLKKELPDAVCRASYLCKLDQKDLLPDEVKQNSFGHTRFKSPKDKQFLEAMRAETIAKANDEMVTDEAVNDTEFDSVIASLDEELTKDEANVQVEKKEDDLLTALDDLLLDAA